MDIDLTGFTTIDYNLNFDSESGNFTMTFTDPNNDDAVLGSITIETSKYRAFMDSLKTVSTEVPEQTFETEFEHVTYYRVRENNARVNFT